jgi:F1F0 ATPase subunit 2
MTTNILSLVIAFSFGTVIGLFYFMGLWWTVRNLPRSRNPSLLMSGSFVLRTAMAAGCFYLIMGNRWETIAVSLLGFVIMRMVLVRRLKPAKAVISEH